MRTETAAEIVARIDAARSRVPSGAVAFDGDGTLWSGDVGEDLFAALLESGRIAPVAHDALAREATAAGIDARGSAVTIAERIHAAYLAGAFPEERVCEIMTWVFAGWSSDELDAFCARVVEEVGLRERLHGEALVIVEHARRVGLEVFLVSASPRAIVARAARVVGIDPGRLVAATELRDASGVVLPDVDRPIPYGGGKVTRLREVLGPRPLYASFGDNAFDVPMLNEAAIPVMIRPKERLLDRAGEVPGAVVLARA